MINSFFRSLIRPYVTVAVLTLCSIQLCAQTETDQDLTQYLFPEFSKSRIKMKAGKDVTSILNYNTVTEKMVFQQNGQLFDMINLESVDTVYLQNRRFVPFGQGFYEIVVNGPIAFFIQHKKVLRSRGMPAAYGGTSEVSSANYISTINQPSGTYNLKLPSDMIIKPAPAYWVRVDNNMSRFFSEKQFLKIFPGKAEQIKQFIRKSGLKIGNREDLIKLGNFCNEIMQ